jgi:hypothetical protein
MIHGNVTVPPGSCSGTACWRQVCGGPDGATGSSSLENSILILLALPAIRLCSEGAPWGGPITAGHRRRGRTGVVHVPGDGDHRDSRSDDHISEIGEQVIAGAASSLPVD